MSALEGSWGWDMLGLDSQLQRNNESSALSKTEPDDTESRITYGRFIHMLQGLGIKVSSLSAFQFAWPVGTGTYFTVYRVQVRAANYQSLGLTITKPPALLFARRVPDMNTFVAFKRMKVINNSAGAEISEPGQLYAISREIQALTHPTLREHDSIIKLQAIIWENGFGAGNESDLPMWPTLVLEYCETTLAQYQLHNPPIPLTTKAIICSKVGAGLDAMHSALIFHGDLKSENVLLRVRNDKIEPKLADFGCSILLDKTDSKKRYWVGGTEPWCAPECPGLFTSKDDIAMADLYSLALLSWKVHLDGANPFDDLGVIPSEWSEKEKTEAVRFLKESDCVSPLYLDRMDPNAPSFFRDYMSGLLKKEPCARREAAEANYLKVQELLVDAIQRAKRDKSLGLDDQIIDLKDLGEIEEHVKIEVDASESSEEDQDPLGLLSLGSLFAGRSFVPDCAKLSTMSSKLALNAATCNHIFEEIVAVVDAYDGFAYPQRCPGCLELTLIDTDPHTLTPQSLLSELQRYTSEDTVDKHTCPFKLFSMEKDHYYMAVHGFGGLWASKKATAIYQLYLAYCAGFGTENNVDKALNLLEDSMTSGYSGFSVLYCLLSSDLGRELPIGLPFRRWLTTLVLFQSGIPSDPFRALNIVDPVLAEIVAAARSKVYNGSTASFENAKFNDICCENGSLIGVPLQFLGGQKGSPITQEEHFENTLLHLIAGSDNPDTSALAYCVCSLDIDINVRNADGATPLLMACRAGRKEKIMALLQLGADVSLTYVGGETPLHWLGLLSDPLPVLTEFLRRGADIEAQVYHVRALPNFHNFLQGQYMYGSPLTWAISLRNTRYVDALIDHGADVHLQPSNGFSPLEFSCRPQYSQYLENLAEAAKFHVSEDEIYVTLLNWTTVSSFQTLRAHRSQEDALKFLLSKILPVHDEGSIYDLYRHTIPRAIEFNSFEILKILLESLKSSLRGVQKTNPGGSIDTERPLSRPTWKNHRLTHSAAARGHPGILTLVLSYGGNAADIDDFGRSTLHSLALSSNNGDCVDALVQHGALAVLDHPTWPEGMTAFGLAVASCNFEVADRLFDHTPEIQRQKIMSSQPNGGFYLPELSFFGLLVAMAAMLGEKPLEYFCSLPEVRKHVDKIFIVDEERQVSALTVACGTHSGPDIYDSDRFVKSRRRRAMAFLLKTFSEQRHRDARDRPGCTALHYAALIGSHDMAGMLLESQADMNAINNSGGTPLDLLYVQDPPLLRELKESEDKIIIQNYENGRNDICKHLRNLGALHNFSTAEEHRWSDHLPFPWIRKMRELFP